MIITKHHIELTPESIQPIQSAPYQARPKARKCEEAEINKMQLLKVIEPVKIEWVTPMVIAPKKDGSLHF